MERRFFVICSIVVVFFRPIAAEGANVTLDCSACRNITSPGYPAYYENDLHAEWRVIAPKGMGIIVEFKSFSTVEYDTLQIVDPAFLSVDQTYSGRNKIFSSFISLGSLLTLLFKTNEKGRERGFLLGLRYYNSTDRLRYLKLSNGSSANEGIFKVSSPESPNEWLPVCPETWTKEVADLVCIQMGYPGVYWFSSNGDALEENSTCAITSCKEKDVLIQECLTDVERKSQLNATKLYCYNHGYLGCFPLPQGNQAYSTSSVVADCISLCFLEKYELAAIRLDRCYCLNASQAQVEDFTSDDGNCLSEMSSIGNWAYHYNVTTGFCDHPGDVAQGWWSSNQTNVFLGSRLTLTCEAGYVINGSKTIECKPYHAAQKIDWDYEIPHCQSLISTSPPPTETPPEPSTTPKAHAECSFVCHVLVFVCLLLACLGLIVIFLLLYYRKRHVCRTFTNKQLTMRNSPTTSVNDLSPSTVTPIKSTGQGAELEIPTAAPSTQNGCESSIRNGPKEETIKGNPQQEERPTSVLSAEISLADEYATVNKLRQDDKCSSRAATTNADKRETRADALLEGFDDRAEMPVKYPNQTSFSMSHTMKNRPLPQCPKDGAIKPPIAPRKAQTLTRQDQAGASFSMNTSKENLLPSTAPRDKGRVNKKAPGGSTPYVKARGKRANNNKKKGDHQVEDVSCDDSSVSSPQRLSDVSSSAYSAIDHSPDKRNTSSEKSVSCNNNSNSVLEVINAVPPEQVYFDIDDTNGNEVSTDMIGGAFGLDGNGRFGDDLKPSSPACPTVQQANNLYHTLEPTNAEYEDIGLRNTEAKFDGYGAYDLLNF